MYFKSNKNLFTQKDLLFHKELMDLNYQIKPMLELDNKRQKPISTSLSLSSTKQSAITSNAIEGIIIDQAKNEIEKSTAINLNNNYIEILEYIKHDYQSINISRNEILNFHKFLFKNTIHENSIAGKFKNTSNTIIDNDNNILFSGSEPWETPIHIDQLCDWFNQSELPYWFKSIIFIYDFLMIHPFSDGNGRISRILTNLLFLKSDFCAFEMISLENIILENKEKYYFVLKAGNENWRLGESNYRFWIDFNESIIISAYKELINLYQFRLHDSKGLNKKQVLVNIINIILNKQKNITTKDLQNYLCTNEISIQIDTIKETFKILVNNNLLYKSGSTKATSYTKKELWDLNKILILFKNQNKKTKNNYETL